MDYSVTLSLLLLIYFNIIVLSKFRSPKYFLFSTFAETFYPLLFSPVRAPCAANLILVHFFILLITYVLKITNLT
jgi:hypothetical protein